MGSWGVRTPRQRTEAAGAEELPEGRKAPLRRALTAVVLLVATGGLTGLAAGPATAADPGCQPLPKPDGSTWRCTFNDDFSGSILDSRKWAPLTTSASGFTGGGECLVSNGKTLSVRQGALHLTTLQLSKPVWCTQPTGAFTTSYQSGGVLSKGRFSQAFGRFEFRARFPSMTTAGVSQAMWLYPDNPVYGKWPASGEIDVAEHYSAWPSWINYNLKYAGWDTDATRAPRPTCRISDPTAYHSYVLEWTPSSIEMQYDGVSCWKTSWSPLLPFLAPQPFDQPFHMIMNQALGTGTNAPVSGLPTPVTMDVDWVRVWS